MSSTQLQPAKAKARAQEGNGVPDWTYLEERVQGKLSFLDSEGCGDSYDLYYMLRPADCQSLRILNTAVSPPW